jgi:hypothetical protein
MDIDEWNNRVLASQGVKHKSKAPKVSRNVGDLQQARLADGTIVRRQELIYIEGQGLIPCAPYELHFLYEVPKTQMGWGLYCTCGSIAGVVGLNAYSKLAAPTYTGKMLVCIRHTTLKNNEGIGRHADDSTE